MSAKILDHKPLFLEFKNVTVVKATDKKILDSLSLTVREGESIAILGPNGAGKSSLIKTITREYYPLSGANTVFRVLGRTSWNIFDLRFLFGIVSSDLQYTFTRDITGLEVVLSGFFGSVGLYKENITPAMQDKASEVIEFLEITHLKNQKINTMSSGEARRFLIGRALVHDPKTLVLDEPANSLDLHSLYKFSAILSKIVSSGVSIILVTQNLSNIIPEISRVILMKQGRICSDGPKEEILQSQSMSALFDIPVEIKEKDGYYYAMRVIGRA